LIRLSNLDRPSVTPQLKKCPLTIGLSNRSETVHSLPPLSWPSFNLDTIRMLAPGALAIALY
jgi:hypothetical protein